MGKIDENLAQVRSRIATAATRSGRDAASVSVVAVTKTRGAEVFGPLLEAGVADVGENRVQDAVEKSRRAPAGLTWHLVGHLQTNKVKKALALFRVIHSVDSLRLAQAIQEEAAKTAASAPAGDDRTLVTLRDELYGGSWDRMLSDLRDRLHGRPGTVYKVSDRIAQDISRIERLRGGPGTIDAFIEVNSGEAQKSGLPAAELPAFLASAKTFDRIRWVGLMTMAPFDDDPEKARPHFRRLRELRDEARKSLPSLAGLSMGMTNDFEVAVEEGATHVRIGRAIFEGV